MTRTLILVGAILIVLAISGSLGSMATAAEPPTEPTPVPLNCLSCHNKTLKGHDKLGSGNQACWSCHYNVSMKTLHLAGGTQVPLSDSPKLCAQCHQKRYESWFEGTHGVPAWREGSREVRGSEKVACAACHNPHQPQVVLSNITLPHPPPAPPPPPPPIEPVAMLNISALNFSLIFILLLILAVGVGVATKRKRP